MKAAFERFFYGAYGASRAYLFAKLFLLMLALDTWMLMIGHAGRYGVAHFNVAHFGWLDALAPTPSAGFYIAVLLLTGLLALFVVFTGLRRAPLCALFLLYTFSWSMSMLDSYQHHYFVSLVLSCLAFFPEIGAVDVHPLPAPVTASAGSHKDREARARARRSELFGFLYAGSIVAIGCAYALIDTHAHSFVAVFLFASALVLATWFYSPADKGPPARVHGFGFNLLGASVAIVYCFTASAKLDANWLAGHTIREISSGEQVFAALVTRAGQLGIEHERFWSLLARAVIPQEFALAGCYLLAVLQDGVQSRLVRALCACGFALAVTLHVGAELMGLQIGWFSYYMLLLACCFLLPLPIVDRLATVLTWPARALTRYARELEREAPPSRVTGIAFALAACALLFFIGDRLDLPGAMPACVLAGAALLAFTLARGMRAAGPDPRVFTLATTLAAFAMWLAIAASPVRWDFYRYLGGDMSRRHQPEAALDAYQKGERYAPPGKSRREQIEKLKRELGR